MTPSPIARLPVAFMHPILRTQTIPVALARWTISYGFPIRVVRATKPRFPRPGFLASPPLGAAHHHINFMAPATGTDALKKMQEAEDEIKSLKAASAQLQRQIDQSRRISSTPATASKPLPPPVSAVPAPEQPIQSIAISEGSAKVLLQVYKLGHTYESELAIKLNTNIGNIQYHLDLLRQLNLVSNDQGMGILHTTAKGRAYVVAKGLDNGQR